MIAENLLTNKTDLDILYKFLSDKPDLKSIEDLLVLDDKELDEYLNSIETFSEREKEEFFIQLFNKMAISLINYKYINKYYKDIKDQETLELMDEMSKYREKTKYNLLKIANKCKELKEEGKM